MLKNTSRPRKREAELLLERKIQEKEKSHVSYLKEVEFVYKTKQMKLENDLEAINSNIELVGYLKNRIMHDQGNITKNN